MNRPAHESVRPETPFEQTGDRAGRRRSPEHEQHLQQVDRLVAAASGLASTIAATEELAQQRADLVHGRGLVRRPAPDGNGNGVISLSEAARRTGRHPEVLRRWCVEGRIPAVRIGRTWAITPQTLAELVTHSARSRPRLPSA